MKVSWVIFYDGPGWYGCRQRDFRSWQQGLMVWRRLDGDYAAGEKPLKVWRESRCELVGYIDSDSYPHLRVVYP